MITLHDAFKRHSGLCGDLRCDDPDRFARAESGWDAVTGREESPGHGTTGEAFSDTMPEEHRTLLASNETAAVTALRCLRDAVEPSGRSAIQMRDAARAGWAAFAARAKNAESMARGFGWDLSEAWKVERDLPPGSYENANVRQIAQMAGRMYAAMRGANASKVSGAVGELHSVEQGDDLSRMLPTEHLLLADPAMEIEFTDRFVSKRLLQYSVRGKTKASKGPLVVLIDESSSMEGQRNAWAKAVVLAISRVAKDEGRPMFVIHYSTSVYPHALDPNDAQQVLSTIRSFLRGGTKIGWAMQSAVTTIAKMPGADAILVTDGVDHDSWSIEKACDALDGVSARLWTVAVECRIDESHPLRRRAAGYTTMDGRDLTDPKSAVTITKGAMS